MMGIRKITKGEKELFDELDKLLEPIEKFLKELRDPDNQEEHKNNGVKISKMALSAAEKAFNSAAAKTRKAITNNQDVIN